MAIRKASRRQLTYQRSVFGAFFCIFGLVYLGKVAWHFPVLHLWAAIFLAGIFSVSLMQFWRVRRICALVREIPASEDGGALAGAAYEVARTWQWGSTMFFAAAMGALLAYHLLR